MIELTSNVWYVNFAPNRIGQVVVACVQNKAVPR